MGGHTEGVPEELLESVAAAYKRQGGTGTIRNQRGAGRKGITRLEGIGKAKCLREKGIRSGGLRAKQDVPQGMFIN